jgi:UDP-N-acetylglucosamine 2-epimerase (non-hydrolysing)
MKVAPVLLSLRDHGHEPLLVHTGQHHDAQMSEAFFQDLRIPTPDFFLGVGSGTHAQQTARIMEAFEPVLLETRPAWVVVVGDVNSTLACALVAAKLKEEVGCRIAHIEAGLRSGDWRMPEEINRVLTDRLSDLLLTPSHDARENLLREGIDDERIRFVGNVMIDTLFMHLPAARRINLPAQLRLKPGDYALVTLHRPSNVDAPEMLRGMLEAISSVALDIPVVFPVHPRTWNNAVTGGMENLLNNLRALPPLGYIEMLSLIDGAAVVITDSGGLQEETTALGVPCVTLREQTERPVTLLQGTNRLVPWPVTAAGLRECVNHARGFGRRNPGESCPEGWDGHAALRIVEALGLIR